MYNINIPVKRQASLWIKKEKQKLWPICCVKVIHPKPNNTGN